MSIEYNFKQALKYLKIKDYTLAIVNFSEALEHGYSNPDIHYYLAVCYANMNYYKEALAEIDTALGSELEENMRVQLMHIKAYIMYKMNDNDSALKLYESILNIDSDNQIALTGLGYFQYLKKDYKRALTNFKKAYEINKDNSKAKNNYGYLLMLNNRDIETAVKLCEEALAADPENPTIQDSVAWGNFLIDNIRKSIMTISKAISKLTDNTEVIEHYNTIASKVRKLIGK